LEFGDTTITNPEVTASSIPSYFVYLHRGRLEFTGNEIQPASADFDRITVIPADTHTRAAKLRNQRVE